MNQKSLSNQTAQDDLDSTSLRIATGWVESVDKDRAYVVTQRSNGCQSCDSQKSCGTSVLAQLFSPANGSKIDVENTLDVKAGDEVELSMDESRLIHHSLMAYGLPLLGLFVGALSFQWLGNGEGDAAADGYALIGSLLGLLSGWWMTRRYYRPQLPRLHKVIHRIRDQKKEQE